MSEENLNLIKNVYDKFNGRDFSGVLELFCQDFEWIAADNSPLADRSPYHGTEAIRDGVFARIAAGFSKLTVKIDEIFAGGNKVVVLGYYNGNFAGSERPLRSQLAHIWTVSDGKAMKFQQYVDTYQISNSTKAPVAAEFGAT